MQGAEQSDLTFSLRSTVTGAEVFCETFAVAVSAGYAPLQVTLPEGTPVGEYTYCLTDAAGDVVACGLCQIGPYRREMLSQAEGGFNLKQAK